MRIDADSHVDETEATWAYLGENEVRFKPTTLEPGTATLFPNSRDQAWQAYRQLRVPLCRHRAHDQCLAG